MAEGLAAWVFLTMLREHWISPHGRLLHAGALLAQTIEELRKLAEQDGQPAYRGKQLHDGLMRGAQHLDDFSNVSYSALPVEAVCPITSSFSCS